MCQRWRSVWLQIPGMCPLILSMIPVLFQSKKWIGNYWHLQAMEKDRHLRFCYRFSSPKENQCWMFIGRTDSEAETPILCPRDVISQLIRKKPWCWGILRAGGEGGNRVWSGWMASVTQCTWAWANSGRDSRTGKRGVLGHRLRHKQQLDSNNNNNKLLILSSF